MAESKIQSIFNSTDEARVYKLGPIWIQIGTSNKVNHKTTTDYSFPVSFNTKCLAAIPVSGHLGFAGSWTISIGNVTKSGCQVYHYNSASAYTYIQVIAIGY